MTTEYENSLRRLIIQIIGGDDDSPYHVPEERITKWKEKRDIESKTRNGILLEKRLLYYSDFYDLGTIIHKNWELFLPILKDKKRFEVFFSEVEDFRNSLAHGRNLTSSQEYFLKGIESDLKNLITIYHNKNEMKDDFFIEILKINDSLGNIWEPNKNDPKPILRVGDDYELIVEANDPKDREIEYEILSTTGFGIKQKNNRFNFKIPNELTGSLVSLFIYVRTPDSEYKNESVKMLSFIILPLKE
jgi:hypothetical protein